MEFAFSTSGHLEQVLRTFDDAREPEPAAGQPPSLRNATLDLFAAHIRQLAAAGAGRFRVTAVVGVEGLPPLEAPTG